MTIYLDAVWLLNFLLDWMILMLVQSMTRNSTKRFRLIAAAFVASILVPITIFLPNSLITTPIGKITYSLLIVWCAFGFKNYKQYVKNLFSFYFISFVLGGGLIAIHFLIGNQVQASGHGILTFQAGYGDQISWLFVGVGFPAVWWFTKTRLDKHKIEQFKHDQMFEVTIEMKGESFSTTGYVDSGNQLVDPFTNKPVIICDQAFIANWFTIDQIKLLEKVQTDLSFESLPDNLDINIHIVPYQGVGGNRTFMIVLKPDKLLVNFENKQIATSKVLIGLQFGELASDGSYHCLLHPQLFMHSVATSA
ncbi:sigma-E processing peptidase SpoIIGA [Radiobacillus sp. PE A8.2]|uniref:sigma-E processing peptidase SpoIIGA n=1 Tax=Radiobacillus sp. PE A8.2 TaxID=3380349 RepID=UPI00388E040A